MGVEGAGAERPRRLRNRRGLSLLLALALLLTGLGLDRSRETPVLGRERVVMGTVAILAGGAPRGDLCPAGDQSLAQPVRQTQGVSGRKVLRSADAALTTEPPVLAVRPFGLSGRFAGGSALLSPSWRAVTRLIHQTRRKRR